MMKLIPVKENAAEEALNFARNGGRLMVVTYMKLTIIDAKTIAKFEKAGAWLLKADGAGYRLRSGKSSVYLLPGQLKMEVEA